MAETSANGHDTALSDSAHARGPHIPAVHVPGLHMPSGTAGNVLWWGGLATVAALGVVDWPVAALVAAGTWVAEQHAKAAQRTVGQPAAASQRAA
jgi:hypothetical protein